MAIYEDGSFDVHYIEKKNGETIALLGLDYVEAFEEFAKKKGVSKKADIWGAKHNQLLSEFKLVHPDICKDYDFEKKNFFDSEEVAENAEPVDVGTAAKRDIELDRLLDEADRLKEVIASSRATEHEIESAERRLIELDEILARRETFDEPEQIDEPFDWTPEGEEEIIDMKGKVKI